MSRRRTPGCLDVANAVERDHPLAAGLRLFVGPDGGAGGRWADVAGYGGLMNHGTLAAGAAWGQDPAGRGVSFDGTGSYVDLGLPDSLKLQLPWSVVASIRLDANGNYPMIVGRTSAWSQTTAKWGVALEGGSRFVNVVGGGSTVDTVSTVTVGAITILAVSATAAGTTVWIYSGGALTTESIGAVSDPSYATADDNARIGCYTPGAGAGNGFFQGLIFNVMVYARGLVAAEVLGAFDQVERGFPDLLRWYRPRAWSFGVTAAPLDDEMDMTYYPTVSW